MTPLPPPVPTPVLTSRHLGSECRAWEGLSRRVSPGSATDAVLGLFQAAVRAEQQLFKTRRDTLTAIATTRIEAVERSRESPLRSAIIPVVALGMGHALRGERAEAEPYFKIAAKVISIRDLVTPVPQAKDWLDSLLNLAGFAHLLEARLPSLSRTEDRTQLAAPPLFVELVSNGRFVGTWRLAQKFKIGQAQFMAILDTVLARCDAPALYRQLVDRTDMLSPEACDGLYQSFAPALARAHAPTAAVRCIEGLSASVPEAVKQRLVDEVGITIAAAACTGRR